MSCLQVDLLTLAEQRLSRRSQGPLVMWVVRKFTCSRHVCQTKHLSMILDSAEEVHLVCPAHKMFMKSVTKLTIPSQLETAGGELTLDTIGDLHCGGIVCHGCVFNPLLTVSLFSTASGEKCGHVYVRRPKSYGVSKRTERRCEARALWWTGLPRRRRGTISCSCCAHTWLGR